MSDPGQDRPQLLPGPEDDAAGQTGQVQALPPGTGGGALVDGGLLAIGTLTALPVQPPSTVDAARARVAMLLAPVVALVPGSAAALAAAAALAVRLSPLVAAALAMGALALATRGFHLDGLADTADGLASSYDRARSLDVMRRGNTGPAGVAMVVLVLAVQVAALAQALQKVGPVAALVAAIAGRLTLPLLCTRGVPAARATGLGAAMAGSVPRASATVVAALAAVAGAGLTRGLGATASPTPSLVSVFGALAVLASALAGALLARRAVHRLGGVTGDVLGACVEVGTATALVVLAAVPVATVSG